MTTQSIISSNLNSNDFGWILLTGTNAIAARNVALLSVRQATPTISCHTEECSILSVARQGETWTDVVLESIFRNAVKNATRYHTQKGTTARVAVIHLWQLTDLFVSKRSSENWKQHVCVQDSDRTSRKLIQCHTQLKTLQKRHGIHIIVVATATHQNATVDSSSLLPPKVRACFRYHIPISKPPTPQHCPVAPSTASSASTAAPASASAAPQQSPLGNHTRHVRGTFNAGNSDQECNTLDWGSVVGMETVKQSLLEAVVWSRTKRLAFQRLGVRPSRGILLYGPPGTGKTLVARTVAAKANVYFLSMSFADIVRSGVGESEAAIALAFEQARRNAPSVLFIDEIQALFSERKTAGQVAKKMISQLLQEMDGLGDVQLVGGSSGNNEQHVVVLAATNLPQCLDPALLRPGRFDKLIHVGLPNAGDRETMFRNLLGRGRRQKHGGGRNTGGGGPANELSRLTETEVTALCQYVGEKGTQLTGAEIENVYRIAIGGGSSQSSSDGGIDGGIEEQTKQVLSTADILRAIQRVRTTRVTAMETTVFEEGTGETEESSS